MDMLKQGENFDQLNPLVLIFICTFDFYKEGRYVYTFKSRCLENLELELANDVTVKLVNAKGKQGQVNDLLKNFLQYVMTNEPVDDFTEDVERQVWAVKNDKKAREEYMVLQAKIREHEIVAYEAGEAQGEAKKSRETAIEMLKDGEPLTKIMKYSKLDKEAILLLAKENGLEVIGG